MEILFKYLNIPFFQKYLWLNGTQLAWFRHIQQKTLPWYSDIPGLPAVEEKLKAQVERLGLRIGKVAGKKMELVQKTQKNKREV